MTESLHAGLEGHPKRGGGGGKISRTEDQESSLSILYL